MLPPGEARGSEGIAEVRRDMGRGECPANGLLACTACGVVVPFLGEAGTELRSGGAIVDFVLFYWSREGCRIVYK